MKSETLELYSKYRYFLYLLSNERLFYFLNEDKEHLDYDKFFDTYNHVISWHWCIKPRWRDYKKKRAYLIKKI